MAISRKTWGARGTVPRDFSRKRDLLTHHSVSPNRKWTTAQEREHMRQLEHGHITGPDKMATIAYSWVIFPSGREYVGRGYTGYTAANGAGNNLGTWAVCFVGDFRDAAPSRKARVTYQKRIRKLKTLGLKRLGAHRDVKSTECPGDGAVDVVDRNARRYKLVRL